MAYENTKVPIEGSQAQIRRMLIDYGADGFGFEEERIDGRVLATIRFRAGQHAYRMRVPLKLPSESALAAKARRATRRSYDEIREEALEQEGRRVWRVIAWNLKARLVAVEEGLETIEEAFLAHLLDPTTDRTVYEHLVLEGGLPALEAGR